MEDLTRIQPPPRKRLTHPPFFSMPLRRRNIIEGDPARLVCNVQGFPEPKISWTKNGLPIHNGEYYKIISRWGTCSLEIEKSMMRDTGTYRCMAVNEDGEESTACELVVDESKYKHLIFWGLYKLYQNDSVPTNLQGFQMGCCPQLQH